MGSIACIDIGGTHCRFALARAADGRIVALEHETVMKVAAHASLATAWAAWVATLPEPAPRRAGIAVAGPVTGDVIAFTNNPWVLRRPALAAELGVDEVRVVNDFAAVAGAVAQLGPESFAHLCGPEAPLPRDGVVTVVGPGTGLGVAMLVRGPGGDRVVATEGGHIDFAPRDAVDDAILARLRARHRRVSVERVVAGPGFADIHATLAAIEGRAVPEAADDAALWAAALSGGDPLAAAALDRFCRCLGGVAGDLALAQGAAAVVIAGGLGLRLARHLPTSGFAEGFAAKGRFEAMMRTLPVKLVTHPQPGLLGAAAAVLS